jgi:hypothetical protein
MQPFYNNRGLDIGKFLLLDKKEYESDGLDSENRPEYMGEKAAFIVFFFPVNVDKTGSSACLPSH